ncbi:hypothetical protein NDI53_20400 [Leptolyngbya sp. NM3-A1]
MVPCAVAAIAQFNSSTAIAGNSKPVPIGFAAVTDGGFLLAIANTQHQPIAPLPYPSQPI